MNPDIRPQDDLFGHVNGTWLDTTEIPLDERTVDHHQTGPPRAH